MGDITTALRAAQSGLLVNQQALSFVSQNVANVNTDGYSRKLIQQESLVLSGQGAGVNIAEVRRVIDEGLLKSIRLETSDLASATSQETFWERMQEAFGAPGDNSSISHIIEEFKNAAELLAVNPDRVLEQSEMVRQAQRIAEKLNDMSSTIQDLRLQADQTIADSVDEINVLTGKIDQLNDDIIRFGTTGTDTSDLRDQRDASLDQLAELIDIRYFYRNDGDVVVFTSSGKTLVDTVPPTVSHTRTSTMTPTSTAAGGQIDGIYVGDRVEGNDITTDLRSGKLKGLVDIRDNVLPNLQAQLDELASELRDTVNQLHNQGAAFPGVQDLTGTRIFALPGDQTIKLTNSTEDVVFALFDDNGDQLVNIRLTDLLSGSKGLQTYGDGSDKLTGFSFSASAADDINLTDANPDTIVLNNGAFEDSSGTALAAGTKLIIGGTGDSGDGRVFTVASVSTTTTTNDTVTLVSGDNVSDFTSPTPATTTIKAQDITVTELAARLEDFLQLNGAASASVAVTDGKLTVAVNQSGVNLAIRDESGTSAGSTAANASVSFDANGDGVTDENVSGFSYFFGLNDLFVDGLVENVKDSKVLSSTYTTSAATLTFRDANTPASGSALGTVSVPAGSTLSEIASLINTNVTNVTASVVTEGSGVRLRIAHDNGSSLIVAQASGNTLLTDIGLKDADIRTASSLTVRSDIVAAPSLVTAGRVQFDSSKGAAGEYLLSPGDNTNADALASLLSGTNGFDTAGGLPNVNISFTEYASSILSRNATQADTNERSINTQKSLTDSLQFKSDSIRGVNLDEELSDLIVFEQAFAAAARVISTIQEMIDKLEQAVS